ncbi:MAG: OmpA family protein [Planctomycetota bacterium]|jgi:hypothetical protein
MNTKNMLIVMSLLCTVLMTGCQDEQVGGTEPIDKGAVNRAIVDTYSDLAIQNAIIAQHTLYPYHFVPNGVDLNDLGRRDLSVLIEQFKVNPGTLTVQQGSVESVLYQLRAQMVYEKLMEAGIPQSKINVTDGMPGGSGMSSTMLIEILETAKEAESNYDNKMEVQF